MEGVVYLQTEICEVGKLYTSPFTLLIDIQIKLDSLHVGVIW